MKVLSVFSLEQAEQWDAIVRSFKEFDTYWLSGYVKAFQIHGDGEPLLFYYEKNDTRGIHVAMKRDVAKDRHFQKRIPEGQYFDFASPYGYGGWLIEGTNREEVFDTYLHWLEKSEIICEFVRFHPILKNHEVCNRFFEIRQLGEVVHMDLTSPELIWNNITSKNRNVIRKAIKNGVKIYNGRNLKIYERFREIYNSTMDKDRADTYYYFEKEFYCSVLEDLRHNAQVFWAEKNGSIIAASIMLTSKDKMNYHLSGSMKEYSSLAPTNLLLYEAALWGNANGFKTLYLGGGVGSGEDNLFRFKRAFYRGELNHFFIGKKIYDQEKYNMLLRMRTEALDSEYFPAYRG